MLAVLSMIEKRGALEKMRKVRQYCNQIFRYSIATRRAEINPAAELTRTLTAPKSAHFPHFTSGELPAFLTALVPTKRMKMRRIHLVPLSEQYLTPLQRHTGENKVFLSQREDVYQAARAANPKRWSGPTRNWEWQGSTTLNPEREK